MPKSTKYYNNLHSTTRELKYNNVILLSLIAFFYIRSLQTLCSAKINELSEAFRSRARPFMRVLRYICIYNLGRIHLRRLCDKQGDESTMIEKWVNDFVLCVNQILAVRKFQVRPVQHRDRKLPTRFNWIIHIVSRIDSKIYDTNIKRWKINGLKNIIKASTIRDKIFNSSLVRYQRYIYR